MLNLSSHCITRNTESQRGTDLPKVTHSLMPEPTSPNYYLRTFTKMTFWHHNNLFQYKTNDEPEGAGTLDIPSFTFPIILGSRCLGYLLFRGGGPLVSSRVAASMFRCSFRKQNPCLVQM